MSTTVNYCSVTTVKTLYKCLLINRYHANTLHILTSSPQPSETETIIVPSYFILFSNARKQIQSAYVTCLGHKVHKRRSQDLTPSTLTLAHPLLNCHRQSLWRSVKCSRGHLQNVGRAPKTELTLGILSEDLQTRHKHWPCWFFPLHFSFTSK